MKDNYVDNARAQLAKRIDVEADLLDLYTLIVLIKGGSTTLQDVHDAWAVWRNKTKPDHASIIPFKRLTPQIQELDREYAEAIRSIYL